MARALPTGSSTTSQRPTPKNATRANANKMHAMAARMNLRQFRGKATVAELGEVAMGNLRMLSRPDVVVNSRGYG